MFTLSKSAKFKLVLQCANILKVLFQIKSTLKIMHGYSPCIYFATEINGVSVHQVLSEAKAVPVIPRKWEERGLRGINKRYLVTV